LSDGGALAILKVL